MAAKEMWDYLAASTADSTTLLSVVPNSLVERGTIHQVVHEMDDNDTEVVTLSTKRSFFVTLGYRYLTPANAGTILDMWYSTAEGYGRARSFRWDHPTDGHDYTVKFASDIPRMVEPSSLHSYREVTLRILGRAT